MTRRVVGIIGGLGPCAGILLQEKLLDSFPVNREQEHVPTVTVSLPYTPDRTTYIKSQKGLGGEDGCQMPNPLFDLIDAVRRLADAGAHSVGVACFTAHYWWPYIEEAARQRGMRPVSAISAVLDQAEQFHCDRDHPLALLGTEGTQIAGVFEREAAQRGIRLIYASVEDQKNVHDAIYGLTDESKDPRVMIQLGLKDTGRRPNAWAAGQVQAAVRSVCTGNTRAVAMVCTELSLLPVELITAELDTSEKPPIAPPLIDGLSCLAKALTADWASGKSC